MKSKLYQNLLQKSKQSIVLISFTAAWSGSSQLLINMLEIAEADVENIQIVEVDVEQDPSLVSELGIRDVPTTIILNDGELVDAFIGPISCKGLMEKIDDLNV